MMKKTMRGKLLDLNSLNKNEIAVTNGDIRMNARGDILNNRGEIVKTYEQIQEEYKKNFKKEINDVSLKREFMNRAFKKNNEETKDMNNSMEDPYNMENSDGYDVDFFDENIKKENKTTEKKTKKGGSIQK